MTHPLRSTPSPFTRRRFLASAGIGAAGLTALAACGGGDEATPGADPSSSSVAAGALGSIALQLSWIKNIEFAGEFMADSKGYYTDAGFAGVDLVTGPVDSADALVVAGTVDIGISAPDATARLIAEQGADLIIIGATFQKNPFCILSLEEGTPIRTLADMAGKKIGIQAGTNQAIFEGFCKINNIDTSSFTTTVVQFEPTPLTEKKVDGFMAFLTNEPFLVASEGFTPVTLGFADNGFPLASETFVVSRSALEADRDKYKAFLTAEIKGWNDAIADPESGAKITVDTYGAGLGLEYDGQLEQLKAQNELISTEETKTNGLFTLTDQLVTENISSIGAIGVTITAEDLFDLSLLEEIYAADPSLITG